MFIIMSVRTLAIFALFALISSSLIAAPAAPGPFDSFRTKTGSAVIKCSPDGKAEGSVTPGEAVRSMKKGAILHLMPGQYSSFELDLDNIIIEGESGQFCNISLTLKGRKNIVRNLWAGSLSCNTDFTMVDSIICYFSCDYNEKKMEQEFYNCCFNSVNVYSYKDNKLTFNKCTIASDNSYGLYFSYGDGNLYFINSVLYGKNKLFKLPDLNRGDDRGARMSLDNSLIFGEMALADGTTRSGGVNNEKDEKVFDIKGLRKLCKQVVVKGNIITEKPVFKKDLDSRGAILVERAQVIRSSYSYLDPLVFVLDDKSPGKDRNIGANLNEKGIPVPEQPPQPKDARKPAPPAPQPVAPAPDKKSTGDGDVTLPPPPKM
jgi:hypothetical protein